MSFTDVGNKAAKASKGSDKVFPSKGAGVQVRKTGKPGFPTADQGNSAPRASNGKDGTRMGGMVDGEGTQMTDGGNGPAHGKALGKKWGTSEMSQAFRRRKAGPQAHTVD